MGPSGYRFDGVPRTAMVREEVKAVITGNSVPEPSGIALIAVGSRSQSIVRFTRAKSIAVRHADESAMQMKSRDD
jgi:hypothetical protein